MPFLTSCWQGSRSHNFAASSIVLARDGAVQNLREVFYCRIDACIMTGSEEEIEYVCEETQCYYTDHVYVSESLVKIIESFSGRCSLLCPKPDATSGLMGCELRQEGLQNFIDKISVTCRAGECTGEERPIVVVRFTFCA